MTTVTNMHINSCHQFSSVQILKHLFLILSFFSKAEAYLGSPRASKIEVFVTIINSSQDSEGLF